jgi:hypothetical protein
MKNLINFKIMISLFLSLFFVSCSEKFPMEEVNLNIAQEEIVANTDDESFVSSAQALEIAEKFLSREDGAKTRAFASAKIETVRDEKTVTYLPCM